MQPKLHFLFSVKKSFTLNHIIQGIFNKDLSNNFHSIQISIVRNDIQIFHSRHKNYVLLYYLQKKFIWRFIISYLHNLSTLAYNIFILSKKYLFLHIHNNNFCWTYNFIMLFLFTFLPLPAIIDFIKTARRLFHEKLRTLSMLATGRNSTNSQIRIL